MRGLTPERREFAINVLLGSAWMTVCVALTLWVIVALIVGSVVLGRWIGGWA